MVLKEGRLNSYGMMVYVDLRYTFKELLIFPKVMLNILILTDSFIISIPHLTEFDFQVSSGFQYFSEYGMRSIFLIVHHHHHHHHVVPPACISQSLSRHFSLSFIASGRSSGYIPYPLRAAVCMFELAVLLLLGHMWGSIGVHHL